MSEMRRKTPHAETVASKPDGTSFRDDVPLGWQASFDRLCETMYSISPDARIQTLVEYLGGLLIIPVLKSVTGNLHDAIKAASISAWRGTRRICCHCGKKAELVTRGGWRMPFCTDCASMRFLDRFSPIDNGKHPPIPPDLSSCIQFP